MDFDESLVYVIEHDIADTVHLLNEGHDPFVICAAKLKNVLMIYKTTLSADEYTKLIEFIVAQSDNVPDLKDPLGLLNKLSTGLH